MGLTDRGLLKVGMKADIAVFNPDTIHDVSTFTDPTHYSQGVQHVFVNGKVSIKSTSLKELDEKVTAKLGAVQACYDKSLEFKDTLAGELTISVKAGMPTVAKSTLKDKELETCVVNVLKTASLPTGKSTLVLAFKRE